MPIIISDLAKKIYEEMFYKMPSNMSVNLQHETAKECALIAVRLLIEENKELEGWMGQTFNYSQWHQVKKEIIKL